MLKAGAAADLAEYLKRHLEHFDVETLSPKGTISVLKIISGHLVEVTRDQRAFLSGSTY